VPPLVNRYHRYFFRSSARPIFFLPMVFLLIDDLRSGMNIRGFNFFIFQSGAPSYRPPSLFDCPPHLFGPGKCSGVRSPEGGVSPFPHPRNGCPNSPGLRDPLECFLWSLRRIAWSWRELPVPKFKLYPPVPPGTKRDLILLLGPTRDLHEGCFPTTS